MSSQEAAPSRDELLAMAYVDDQLAPAARAEFEERLKHESHLLREVAELRQLELIARQVTPLETADVALARFDDAGGRVAVKAGWLMLLIVAIAGLAAIAVTLLVGLPWPLAILAGLGFLGLLLLFLTVLRRRLAVLPHDPYREVQR